MALNTNIVEGNVELPSYVLFKKSDTLHYFAMCRKGSALLIDSESKLNFLRDGTIAYINHDAECSLLLGRGQQSWIFTSWEREIDICCNLKENQTSIMLVSDCNEAVSHVYSEIYNHKADLDAIKNLSFGLINLLIHELTRSKVPLNNSVKTEENNSTIKNLTQLIRSSPQRNWNLSTAAEIAGYSVCHLSRVFKTQLRMGFPEFVERSRSDIALQLLISTDKPTTIIAELSGFSTTQSMRNALKLYSGFLPSEIRGRFGE